jgi:hypothetical protein
MGRSMVCIRFPDTWILLTVMDTGRHDDQFIERTAPPT